MKMIGEILTAEQMADLARLVPKMGDGILEMTEEQLDFLRGYVEACKILNDEMLVVCDKSDKQDGDDHA